MANTYTTDGRRVGSGIAPSTLPRSSRNHVVDLTDSPGHPIHVQDSPVVETHDLQYVSIGGRLCVGQF